MTGAEIFNALIQRGYSPEHAAALGGHILQESGGDPTNVNAKEGAHGLLQWRLDRWNGLKNYAVGRNASPEDPNVQLDYIAKEMAGPEASSGARFLAANDLPSASAALKGYIRFGDNSGAARLRNGQALLGVDGMGAPGNAAPMPGPAAGNAASAASSDIPTPAAPDTGLTAALQNIPKIVAQQQQQDLPQMTPMQMPGPVVTPAMLRARQMAAAMLSKPINPETPT